MSELFFIIIGLSQKKIVPPVKDIIFFEVDLPEFPVNFMMTPLEFSTFLH